MIFLGDLASPDISSSESLHKVFLKYPEVFSGKRIICNFEGLVYDGSEPIVNEPVLYNHSSVIEVLKQNTPPVFCLANNHILDLPGQFEYSARLFDKEGILFCGAGPDMEEAEKPVLFSEGSRNFALFNVCWDFLLYNHRNPRSGIYVAEIKEEKLIERIKSFKEDYPLTSIIVYTHWSLDLEILPFPMYRQFSQDLISAGTDMVLGSHSHCIQGGEKYKHGYIIYGLGNFFLPHNKFINGKLVYPKFSNIELVLEWDIFSNEIICHWFRYENLENDHSVLHLASELFENSELLAKYSPFTGMNIKEYIKLFRKERRKKILIPIYKDYRKVRLNSAYTSLLKIRANTARILAKFNIIKWQH
jgi:hypothetical protein